MLYIYYICIYIHIYIHRHIATAANLCSVFMAKKELSFVII